MQAHGGTKSATSSLDRTTVSNENQLPTENQLPRLLVLNSEIFTLWKDHYSRLQDVVNSWEPQGQRIMTLGD